MTPPDHLKNPDQRILRQFLGGWIVFFLGLGAYQFVARDRPVIALGCGAAAAAGAALHWLSPAWFRRVFTGWMLVAWPLGWVMSQLALAIMFYGIVTPVALLFRLGGRDRIRRRKPVDAASYWTAKPVTNDVRRYFRTF